MATVEAAELIFKELHSRTMDAAVKAELDKGTTAAAKLCKRKYFVQGRGRTRPDKIVSRTGRLRSTVKHVPARKRKSHGTIVAGIQMGDSSTPQARILELGGTTRPHIIRARRAPTLAFYWEKAGRWVFPVMVRHPGSRITGRKVLQNALKDSMQDITWRVLTGVKRAFKEEWH